MHAVFELNPDSGTSVFVQAADALRNLLTTAGWVEQYYSTDANARQMIFSSAGYNGIDNIVIGFNVYRGGGPDRVGIFLFVIPSYTPGLSPFNQPMMQYTSVLNTSEAPAVLYLAATPQCVIVALKGAAGQNLGVGYVGKMLPYARPQSWPVGAMLYASSGNGLQVYSSGWQVPNMYPHPIIYAGQTTAVKVISDLLLDPVQKIEVYTSAGLHGALEDLVLVYTTAAIGTTLPTNVYGVSYIVLGMSTYNPWFAAGAAFAMRAS